MSELCGNICSLQVLGRSFLTAHSHPKKTKHKKIKPRFAHIMLEVFDKGSKLCFTFISQITNEILKREGIILFLYHIFYSLGALQIVSYHSISNRNILMSLWALYLLLERKSRLSKQTEESKEINYRIT